MYYFVLPDTMSVCVKLILQSQLYFIFLPYLLYLIIILYYFNVNNVFKMFCLI